ncbi:MAG: hypothetical protein R3Y53_09640 [Bacillota bacterium]
MWKIDIHKRCLNYSTHPHIIRRTHVTPDEYALFKIAKEIYYSNQEVSLSE